MNFEQAIIDFNKQLSLEGFRAENLGALEGSLKPDAIIVSGMGGSGLPATILKNLAPQIGLKVPVVSWKSYGLPKHDFKNPLFVFISFSGGTEEVLSGLYEAMKGKFPAAVITTENGGELKRIAEENDLPSIFFNGTGLTPRQGCGRMYYTLIKLLKVLFPNIEAKDLSEKFDSLVFQNEGRILAEKLRDKIVLIYTPAQYSHLGYIWKIDINETSKQPAFTNELPEVDHNEVIGFTGEKFPFSALFLVDSENHPRLNDKMAALESFLNKFDIPVNKTALRGEGIEEKTWNGVMLSLWTSFYLAELNGADPESIDVIEEIKKA